MNYVASQVQMDLQDYTTHNRARILQYCINCFKEELRYKTESSVAVAYLQPNAVLNAPMPKDYEYYTKIAINVGGTLVTLTRNPNIPLIRKYDCGDEVVDEGSLQTGTLNPQLYTAGWWYASHYRAGQYVGEMYSMGGGFNEMGYFRVDKANRQFQFANIPNTEIVLEYVADGKTSGNTLIDFMDVKPIKAYVHWKLEMFNKKSSLGSRAERMGLFYAAMEERKFYEFAPTMSDYLDNCYMGIQSGVKR